MPCGILLSLTFCFNNIFKELNVWQLYHKQKKMSSRILLLFYFRLTYRDYITSKISCQIQKTKRQKPGSSATAATRPLSLLNCRISAFCLCKDNSRLSPDKTAGLTSGSFVFSNIYFIILYISSIFIKSAL